MKHGFVKVAAASPVIRVCDCDYNAEQVVACIEKADALGVKVLAFPELTLTGVTCRDMIAHRVLLEGARKALSRVAEATKGKDMLVFVGLPWAEGAQLLSVAAALYDGEVLGLVPRTETEGSRFQSPDAELLSDGPVGYADFRHAALPELRVAVELGADMDAVIPPSAEAALCGATLIVQMAAFPQTVRSTADAELNIRSQSKRLAAGVVLAAPGRGESTTDHAYSGLCMIAENGEILISAGRAAASAPPAPDSPASGGAKRSARPSSRAAIPSTPTCPRRPRTCPRTASACSTSRSRASSSA